MTLSPFDTALAIIVLVSIAGPFFLALWRLKAPWVQMWVGRGVRPERSKS